VDEKKVELLKIKKNEYRKYSFNIQAKIKLLPVPFIFIKMYNLK